MNWSREGNPKYYFSFGAIIIIIPFLVTCRSPLIQNDTKYQFTCGVARVHQNSLNTNKSFRPAFIIDTSLTWDTGILNVCFMDINDSSLIEKTLFYANEWSNYARIKFKLTADTFNSDIRVSFRENMGFQSQVGALAKDSLFYGKPTMWLSNLDSFPEMFRTVVLHEFGHALGLYHELQSPNSNIQWDTAAVYKYFKKNYCWSPGKVDTFVLQKINVGTYTQFDSKSIMIYAVPSCLTKNHIAISLPDSLSTMDKENIAKYYPFNK